jgi:hypothetical protein
LSKAVGIFFDPHAKELKHEEEMLTAFFLTLRHKDAKTRSFLKTKLLINGKYFQPFEPLKLH